MTFSTRQTLFSEAPGTALLRAVVIGSGVMAEWLAGDNLAVALLANTLATIAGLYVLIEVRGPISGAHFNPVVSLALASRRELAWSQVAGYVVVQMLGAMLGAWLAHAMFDMDILQFSTKARGGMGRWITEAVATFGLFLVILRAPATRVAAMAATCVGAACWFTASTSFANPVAAFGRMVSDSFAGIAPVSVPGFVVAGMVGTALAVVVHAFFSANSRPTTTAGLPESSNV
jgi:glycerol uptake facilitator-like aquaporin